LAFGSLGRGGLLRRPDVDGQCLIFSKNIVLQALALKSLLSTTARIVSGGVKPMLRGGRIGVLNVFALEYSWRRRVSQMFDALGICCFPVALLAVEPFHVYPAL
jgi:hypothetical protein